MDFEGDVWSGKGFENEVDLVVSVFDWLGTSFLGVSLLGASFGGSLVLSLAGCLEGVGAGVDSFVDCPGSLASCFAYAFLSESTVGGTERGA